MRGTLRIKIMSFDRTGKTFTFRGPGNVDQLTGFKQGYSYFATCLQFSSFFSRNSKFNQTATSFNTCFCKMSSFSLVNAICFFLTEGNLNGRITVSIFGFELSDAVRSHFQHGYRNRSTLFVKHASHAYLAPNQT